MYNKKAAWLVQSSTPKNPSMHKRPLGDDDTLACFATLMHELPVSSKCASCMTASTADGSQERLYLVNCFNSSSFNVGRRWYIRQSHALQ